MPVSSMSKRTRGVRLGFACDRNPYDDLSFGREFEGVANEVGQDLPQPSRVSAQSGGKVWRDLASQLNAFAVGPFGQEVQRAFDRFNQIKVEQIKDEFAGFDFGKVQDVIQDRQ